MKMVVLIILFVVQQSFLHSKNELLSKVNHLEQEKLVLTDKMQQQYDGKLKLMEETKANLVVSCECFEKEIQNLKDEIRLLQVQKYDQEQKLREQEQKLHLQLSSKDGTVAQIAELDQNCKSLLKRFSEFSDLQEHLENEVRGATKLNRMLAYVKQHQQCTIKEYTEQNKLLKTELLNLKQQLDMQPVEFSKKICSCQEELALVKQKYTEKSKLVKILERQIIQLESECQKLQLALKETHSLLNRHVDSTAQNATEAALYKEQLEDLQTNHNAMEKAMEESYRKLQILQVTCRDLEDINRKKTEALNVPKEEKGVQVKGESKEVHVQTECYKEEIDRWTQTETSVVTGASQTELNILEKYTQTNDPPYLTCNKTVQTECSLKPLTESAGVSNSTLPELLTFSNPCSEESSQPTSDQSVMTSCTKRKKLTGILKYPGLPSEKKAKAVHFVDCSQLQKESKDDTTKPLVTFVEESYMEHALPDYSMNHTDGNDKEEHQITSDIS